MTKGEELREWREQLRLTVEDAAHVSCVKLEMLRDFEAGKYVPSLAFILQVQLIFASVEALQALFPHAGLSDRETLRKYVEDLHAGRFEGYARRQSEALATRKALEKAGEGA
jgi:transcriptional regulator with XRE-family HTH domain